jgi:hypothetical protein
MADLRHLFDNNQLWAQRIVQRDPDFFTSLAAVQSRDPQAFERLYRNHMTAEGNRLVAQVLATRMAGAAARVPNASPMPRAVR